jgi:hypothetical protein
LLPFYLVPRQRLLGRWATRARVLLTRRQLDRRLAKDDEAASDPALALRAAQLLRPKNRERLAADLERLIQESEVGRPRLSAAVPLDHGRVLSSREALLSIADALRTAEVIRPRGVAMLSALLSQADSPLFAPTDGDLFELYLQTVQRHLVPEP